MEDKDKIIADLREENRLLKEQLALPKKQIDDLKKEIELLKEIINRNSKNSSLPPSHDRTPKNNKKPPSNKGRHGHQGYYRKWLTGQDVTKVVELHPQTCDGCGGNHFLSKAKCIEARQTVEMPPIKPIVTEYRAFACRCADCGKQVKAQFPVEAKKVFGPKLRSICALLTSKFRVSKRSVRELLSQLLGTKVSLGSISHFEEEAAHLLKSSWQEAKEALHKSPTVYADETEWKTKGKRNWLWQASDKQLVVFQITEKRGKKAAVSLLGKESLQNLVTDRRAYSTLGNRQYCWSHLKRNFQKIEDRIAKVSLIGRLLGSLCKLLFKCYREKQEGLQTEEQFKETAKMLRPEFRYLFTLAIRIDVEDKKLGRSGRACERLLAKEENLWHFVDDPTIEPTNNLSERNLRPAVLWRKVSFGTQSERGDRFVERALTLIETLKIQKKNPFEFLAACFRAHFENSKGPSLSVC